MRDLLVPLLYLGEGALLISLDVGTVAPSQMSNWNLFIKYTRVWGVMGMGRILEADSIQLHLLGIEIQPRHAFDPKPYSSRFIHEKLCIGTLCERHLTEIHVVALPPP